MADRVYWSEKIALKFKWHKGLNTSRFKETKQNNARKLKRMLYNLVLESIVFFY